MKPIIIVILIVLIILFVYAAIQEAKLYKKIDDYQFNILTIKSFIREVMDENKQWRRVYMTSVAAVLFTSLVLLLLRRPISIQNGLIILACVFLIFYMAIYVRDKIIRREVEKKLKKLDKIPFI